MKLDAGDVKGEIRVLSSDDTFVTPNLASYNTLLSKHPVVPFVAIPHPSHLTPFHVQSIYISQ